MEFIEKSSHVKCASIHLIDVYGRYIKGIYRSKNNRLCAYSYLTEHANIFSFNIHRRIVILENTNKMEIYSLNEYIYILITRNIKELI